MKETEGTGVEPGSEQPPAAEEERVRHWPRRRLLRWALGLVPIAAGGGWASFHWLGAPTRRVEDDSGEPDGPVDGYRAEAGLERGGPPDGAPDARTVAAQFTQEGAWACFARHPSANGYLVYALKAVESYAPAELVYSCWAMEEGKWDLARKNLSSPVLRDTPEARLLLELAERRSRSPDWRHAFFEAWNALGRPDFSKSPLLPEPLNDEVILPFVHGDLESLDEPRRLPLVTVVPDEQASRPEWGLPQVRASTSVPLLMALRERLLVLPARMPARQRLLPTVEERLGQLAGASPRTLQLALHSFLTGRPPEAPLERRDLETLETLVTLEWKQPSSERFFLEMRERFEGMMLLPGHHAWLLASWAQGVSLGRELLRRARDSAAHLNEDERRWLGRLLWETGTRLREQRSRLELETGLKLQMYGSELTGHSPTRMDSIGLWVELGQWEEALKRAAWYRWPLASLQEESCEPRARDEHAWLKAFAGKGELP
ncbi:hypothetical protein [Vitiosangium sp. GDMCC 1.1324]|uniref:hypothetical protein n=1 Tax=Vitiosangium sp. (strain GDMCC 1.1324) TaxID=2138576 RepID=UPI000D361A65|nr:hypothetical protein [Vitiosangium sp. GDMCC 1.1324]PTL83245.1 hypothetical protein DAT35_14735 [Vitiosangium sp. GDMCC 1.1324]